MKRNRAAGQVRNGIWLVLLTYIIFMPSWLNGFAVAGPPEYMQLEAVPGMALEIEGVWDKSGVFIADDIEKLPKERLPKLRGEIQDVSRKDSTITMYGMPISIYEHTEFIEDGGERVDFGILKKGLRIEVSCKFADDGQWKARKIKTRDVKGSDKIKGTITRVSIDGEAPDTLDMSGIRILLVPETDINDPSSGLDRIEKKLFKDIKLADLTSPTHGVQIHQKVLMNADYRQSLVSETEYDLSQIIDSDQQETEPAARLEATGYFSKQLQTFAQLRMRKKYFISTDRLNPPGEELEVDLTQLYFLARNIGVKGLAVQFGRQDFDEPREWLFDEYLDAARVYYYGTGHAVIEAALIHAVSPLKSEFETWTDIWGQMQWYIDSRNLVSGYILFRSDSDTVRNREPQWYGFRYKGEISNLVLPWLDVSFMRGEDKGRELDASAIDIGATVMTKSVQLSPSLTLAYASASGDITGGDNTDNRFRQTAYEDNVDYFGGVISLHYYGEVLDPELSNIRIMTAGAGIRPSINSSIEFIYHSYNQDRPADEIKGANLIDPPARPNGISDDVGWELDLVAGINNVWNHVSLAFIAGIFSPGQAFEPYIQNAKLIRLNAKIEL